MKKGRYLAPGEPSDRLRRRRLRWMAELVLGNAGLMVLWAMDYIHPAPAGAMMALLSGRLGYRLGRYR